MLGIKKSAWLAPALTPFAELRDKIKASLR